MAPQHGTRDDRHLTDEPDRLGRALSSSIQFIVFCLLVAAAAGLFGAVIMLPEYARLEEARYQLALQEATNARLRALIESNDRYIAELPHDAILTKRLAMNEFGYWPKDEVVVLSGEGPAMHSPAGVVPPPLEEPAPPSGWIIATAQRVSHPPTQRGMALLAGLALIAAVLLFPGVARRSTPAS